MVAYSVLWNIHTLLQTFFLKLDRHSALTMFLKCALRVPVVWWYSITQLLFKISPLLSLLDRHIYRENYSVCRRKDEDKNFNQDQKWQMQLKIGFVQKKCVCVHKCRIVYQGAWWNMLCFSSSRHIRPMSNQQHAKELLNTVCCVSAHFLVFSFLSKALACCSLMMVALTCGGFMCTLSFPPTSKRTVAANLVCVFSTWGGCFSMIKVLQRKHTHTHIYCKS